MKEPISKKNLDGYGAPLIPWEKVRKRLQEGFTQAPKTGGPDRHTAWLATVRPDGRPHVMPVGILLIDGTFYFTSGPKTRKAKNLTRNPNCVITLATHDFDFVVEGAALKVVDPPSCGKLLMRMRSRDGNRRSSRAPSQQSTVHQAQGHLRGKCMK